MDKKIINVERAKKIKLRQEMVQIVYRFFLLDYNFKKIKQEIFDDSQIDDLTDEDKKIMESLIDYIDHAIDRIEPNLSDGWRWYRIPKMIQAILCVALFENSILKTDASIVINESVELTRMYLPSWNEKFVNAVLDKTIKEGDWDE
jgi:N utilization substance protein B